MIRQFRRKHAAVVAALALAMFAAAPRTTSAAASFSLPIVGTVPGGGSFSGVFGVTSFAVKQGQIVAVGTLTGVLTDLAGRATTIVQSVVMPVLIGPATCDILHLDIGPISLDLLGLRVDLSEIVLDVTAQSGPGNLLGNLLCAVANLLNDPGNLVKVLNQILTILIG